MRKEENGKHAAAKPERINVRIAKHVVRKI
jgi:hypothetical protein